ncbi:Cell wall-associated protease precursor [Cecembia lonarensis LW9]|uniref:Cell wall-associated protease n=2 Tax=Cecembia TaxID=1187078 RepID=K1LX03_CECL9|nr:Cell wall-associated protease precursor [Cecembia lonarensis LW9]
MNMIGMNPRKTSRLCLGIVLVLSAACSAVKPVSTSLTVPQNLTLKNTPLQEWEMENWQHLDLLRDTIPGMSVDRTYEELIRKKKKKPIIVAVLDAGIDLGHEDLEPVLWVNPKEIAGTNTDNDGNGFVDDVHGYNFLGESYHERLEYTRIVSLGLGDDNYQQKAREKYDEEVSNTQETLARIEELKSVIQLADNTAQQLLGKPTYEPEELSGLEAETPEIQQALSFLTNMLSMSGSLNALMEDLEGAEEYYSGKLKYHLNLEFDGRAVVGDDPYDYSDRNYGNGNPNIVTLDESHGTHVAGIIAADRENELGIKGVADNVQIMSIRAVPDGDEYDKDIALGIRYAVDNGAKIINASFGKGFSPNAEWVYEALEYAALNNVLIVHAAGNDGMDLDDPENPNFPNDHKFQNGREFVDNVITVGALGSQYGPRMVAPFSNYGANNVDVFAPGAQIYSTMPGNEYEFQSGTSMAAPAVAGVAALIWTYYPKLTAAQVKRIIMESGLEVPIQVTLRTNPSKPLNLQEISKSGKIVNAYNALILARQVAKGKVKI